MTESVSGPNPLALIIEDNEGVAEVCRVALEQAEFEVEHVSNGPAALDYLGAFTPALILLDLHLPHVSGQQILKHIRSQERLAQTRIILTTADLSRAETLQNEVDIVLVKPFGFIQLHELVKQFRSTIVSK
jgi:DNA-binding response OmpR family regulator